MSFSCSRTRRKKGSVAGAEQLRVKFKAERQAEALQPRDAGGGFSAARGQNLTDEGASEPGSSRPVQPGASTSSSTIPITTSLTQAWLSLPSEHRIPPPSKTNRKP